MPAVTALPMVPGNEQFLRGLPADGQRCFGLRLNDVFNRPSRKFAAKIGCEPARVVIHFSIFGLLERSVTLKRLGAVTFAG